MTEETSVWSILPPYVGGKTDPDTYRAGDGLNDTRHIENPDVCPYFSDGEVMTEDDFLSRVTDLHRKNVPAHWFVGKGGRLRLGVFTNSRIAVVTYENDRVHVSFIDDYTEETHAPCPCGVVRETNRRAFETYVDELTRTGWKQTHAWYADGNAYIELQSEKGLVECSYHETDRLARFVYDTVSVPLSDFGFTAEGTTEIYSFGIFHARMISGFTCDCGMCYLIKLADNSLLMIDGGELEQVTKASVNGLWQMMHEITGTKPGDTIRLNWYGTHAHDDHADMFAHLLRLYHDEIDLQRVMFNYPCSDYCYIAPQLYSMISRVRTYYPHVQYRKLHGGDVFPMGNATVTVLQTHEQGLGTADGGHFRGMNDTSTVLKLSFNGVSFVWLGDLDNEAENVLVKHYTNTTLHADGVQGAHHLFNFLNYAYEMIAPDWCIVPQNEECRANHNSGKYGQIAKAVPEDHILFDSMGSFGWREENGKLVCFYHAGQVGTVYDGTDL